MTQTDLLSGTKMRVREWALPSTHSYRSHKNDPETSVKAVDKMESSGNLTKQSQEALTIWRRHSPGTTMQIAEREGGDVTRLYHMLSRRRIDIKDHLQETGREFDGRKEYRVV